MSRPKTVKLRRSKSGTFYLNFNVAPFKNDKRTGFHYYRDAEVQKVADAVHMELTNPRIVQALAVLGRPHKRTELLTKHPKKEEK